MVFSRFNRPKTQAVPAFPGTQTVFEERIIEGTRRLVKTGLNPLNEFVQKSLPETQIYNILRKYENGNVDVLSKTFGQYFDSTDMPRTLQDAQNALIKAEVYFDKLPVDVKNKFNNSCSAFLDSVFDGTLQSKLGTVKGAESLVNNSVKEGEANE